MGGAVSSGEDNADLVEKLMEGDYIKDPLVEKVFRAVDRGDYFLADQRMHAYKDQAWKHGNVHLSAPCIYAEVMEWLKLGPGMSFLNLGSGTGYLSTMAGLILGPYGVNHGVEYYQDVIDYAEEKIEFFIRTNEAFDEFEFCEPTFVRGNCLLLSPSGRLYDRLYCGAACPSEHENYIKKLIKIGGILVMPLNDQLIQVTRVSETQWETKTILPVSFARLIPPPSMETKSEYRAEDDGTGEGERVRLRWKSETAPPPTDLIELPNAKIMTLQEISRLNIRRILLRNIRTEHPNVSRKRPRKSKKRRQPPAKQRRVNFVPTQTGLMFVGQLSDESDGEPEEPERQRMRGRNARENPWSRFGNALITQLFNPYLVFLPGEERDRTEGGMDGVATSEERNADAENGLDEDASLREMDDEPMPDAEAGNGESYESSGDEDNFVTGNRFRLRGALAEATLRVNSDVVAGHERGNINDTSLAEETVVMPTVSAATTPTVTVPVATTSTATAQLATADIATTSTATAHFATASTTTADMATTFVPDADVVTAPTATPSWATADMATIPTDMVKATTATPSDMSNISAAASCSSGVETCSSVDADSVDTETLSSIFWTREFQTDRAETESDAPHGRESETDGTSSHNPEMSASRIRLSPTPSVEQCVLDDFFGRAGSSCDSTERAVGKDAEEEEEEEEAMEAESLEAGPTYRTYLQKKVDQLPIPQSMKQFLVFYRN